MKTASHRLAAGELELGLERRHLAAERVPADGDVDEPEMVAIEHDHPGAGAEDRPAKRRIASSRPYRCISRVNAVDSPPGITSPSSPSELLGLAHLDDVGAEATQHRRVLAEVALHGEDTDPERLHRRQW